MADSLRQRGKNSQESPRVYQIQNHLGGEIHEAGGHITFADLQPMKERHIGRQEKLPEWFTSKDEPKEAAEPNSELTKEKDQLLKKLAEKKERLSKKDTPTS